MTDIFAAIDLSTVSTSVTPLLVAVMGIALLFKGAVLGKRTIKAV